MAERYRPKKISELVGNEQSRLEIVKWLKNWKISSKPLLLIGPPGVGKSSSIYAAAAEFSYNVIEYNASDSRTREKLRNSVGPLLQNSSVFGAQEKLIVFLDEVDGLSGRSDYAGVDFILDFIENSTVPLAMAANVESDSKLKKLEQKSKVVRFKAVAEDVLFIFLRHVSKEQGYDLPSDIIKDVAKNSRGDVRYALNLLQSMRGWKSPKETTDRQFANDADALYAIFGSKNPEEAIKLLRQFDAQPRDRVRYFFDAIVSAKNLSTEQKADALELVARADNLLGAISQKQSWRLLRYLDRYLIESALSKELKYSDSSTPWNLKLSIWNDGKVIREMATVLSQRFHVSSSTFASFYLPFLARLMKERPALVEPFLRENDFEAPEQRVLLKLARG